MSEASPVSKADTNQNLQIKEIVASLIAAAADKDENVRAAILSSLRKLAKKYPGVVLQSAMRYKQTNPKVSDTHITTLLILMEQICQEHVNSIDIDIIHELVTFTVEEMTCNIEYFPDAQLHASGILVALGHKFCIEVMDGLIMKLQPGILPHWAVLHTLANLAAANPFGLVPFVKATLGTLLPMMGSARSDYMRQAFAFALGRLSEAVLEYVAGLSSAPDPTVRAEAFASEVSAAYDVLVSSWLGSRDSRVLAPVLAALGPMLAIQGGNRAREQAPRLIPTLLTLYKRGIDPIPITQCLAAVLQTVQETVPTALEPLLDTLLPSLFEQICPAPDYAHPQTVKNHYEALRCFDQIARCHANRVTESILQMFRNNNERERARAMLVTAHLVGSSERLLGNCTADVISGLHSLPPETGSKAKKALLKAVVALAYRGYLTGPAGVHFVHFLVWSCCQQEDKSGDSDGEDFGRTCASTLFLLASTVPAVEKSLWPLLLHCLLEPKYTIAAGDLARCLSHLAARRADFGPLGVPSQSSDKSQSGEDAVEKPSPSPELVFARSLALLGAPWELNRGPLILSFLKRYVITVNRILQPLWEQRLPELIHHVDALNSDDDLHHREHLWEVLLVDFVIETLAEVDESAWSLTLGNALLKQLNVTPSPSLMERAALAKCLAVAASHASDASLLKHTLDVLLCGIHHFSPPESAAVSRAIGLLSRKHLAPVLARLDTLRKEEAAARKSASRLLGLGWRGSTGGEPGADRVRYTLALCYGELAVEAPVNDLLPALKAGPLLWLLQTLNSSKDKHLKKAVLHSLGCVADGLHPNRSNLSLGSDIRSDVLTQILTLLQSQDTTIMAVTLNVTTAFLKLPPALNTEDRIAVLRVTFEEVFGSLLHTPRDQPGEKSDNPASRDISASCPLTALGELTQALLTTCAIPAALDDVFSLLEPWLTTNVACQRAAALSVLNGALQCYVTNMKFGCEAPSRFGQTGLMLGRVVPRCTDPSMEVRRLSVGATRLILGLAARYEGRLGADNDLVSTLSNVQQKIQTAEPTQLFQATTELAQALCSTLPPLQLVPFVDSLLDGLADSTTTGAAGASVVLTSVLKIKGGELYHQVSPILGTIIRHAGLTKCLQTQTGAVRAVLALARHHPKAVVGSLLLQPLPFEQSVQECWHVIARDGVLAPDVVDQLLHLIQGTPLYEEKLNCGPPIAVLMPLAAVAALQSMLLEPAIQSLATQRFPELFATLLTAAACYIGVAPPVHLPNSQSKETHGVVPNRSAYRLSPDHVARQSLQALLVSAQCNSVADAFVHSCKLHQPESLEIFVDIVWCVAKAICQFFPNLLPKLVTSLNQYSCSNFEPQRIAVVAFFSELVVMQAGGQLLLLEGVLATLLSCLGDPCPLVRKLCLRGLGATASLPPDQQSHHAEAVLSALVRGLDEPDPLEAIRGLAAVLPITDNAVLLKGVTVAIALRVRPFFEKDNPAEREAALRLFGELAQAGIRVNKDQADGTEALVEQVRGALVPLLLHLHDEDAGVIRASKFALRQAAPLLRTPRANGMVQGHLIDAGTLHYEEFATDFIRTLARELPEQVSQLVSCALAFTRGGAPALRGDAALLVGLLCGSIPPDSSHLNTVSIRLMQMLHDDNVSVRIKAAQALSVLFIT